VDNLQDFTFAQDYMREHILQLPCSGVFNVDNLQGICV